MHSSFISTAVWDTYLFTLRYLFVCQIYNPNVFLCIFVFQYDFVELLDGSRLISKDKRSLSDTDAGHAHEEGSAGGARHTRSVNVHGAGFIQYLDTGIWHLAMYNDGRNTEQVSYNTIAIGEGGVFTVMTERVTDYTDNARERY